MVSRVGSETWCELIFSPTRMVVVSSSQTAHYVEKEGSIASESTLLNCVEPKSPIWSHLQMPLRHLLIVLSAMRCILPVSAAPIHSWTPRDNDGGVPNIVSNFQDLSAILTLFAADTVEQKLSDPNSLYVVRMSSVWSIFGTIGALRAYCKIVFGLARSEAAGLNLAGAGAFTLEKTSKALSCWGVGSEYDSGEWQDNSGCLLGQVTVPESLWIRPHMVVVGYSQCPMEGVRGFGGIIAFVCNALWTVVITVTPTLCLTHGINSSPLYIKRIALGMTVGLALIVGCMTPSLLKLLNTMGISRLCDMTSDRTSGQVIRDGDGVITDSKTSASTILWRNPSHSGASRSADLLCVRLLCALSAVIILGAYLFNYILLGKADTFTSYWWLGFQLFTLVLRFYLWSWSSGQFNWFERNPTVLYIITGSLVAPLSIAAPDTPNPNDGARLHESVVRFALASTKSKIKNGASRPLPGRELMWLSGTAPADILCSTYIDIPVDTERLTVASLPGSFVQELYTAQGLVLDRWPPGGIHLGAVFERQCFIGLTTFQSITSDLRDVVGRGSRMKAVTVDGYIIENIGGGTICDRMTPGFDIVNHLQFREKLAVCRRSARANGPTHLHVHTKGFKHGHSAEGHFWKMTETLDDTLLFVREAIDKARSKDHSSCRQFCQILPYFSAAHHSSAAFQLLASRILALFRKFPSANLTRRYRNLRLYGTIRELLRSPVSRLRGHL